MSLEQQAAAMPNVAHQTEQRHPPCRRTRPRSPCAAGARSCAASCRPGPRCSAHPAPCAALSAAAAAVVVQGGEGGGAVSALCATSTVCHLVVCSCVCKSSSSTVAPHVLQHVYRVSTTAAGCPQRRHQPWLPGSHEVNRPHSQAAPQPHPQPRQQRAAGSTRRSPARTFRRSLLVDMVDRMLAPVS